MTRLDLVKRFSKIFLDTRSEAMGPDVTQGAEL
jgi:hypothetical protein